MLRPPPQARVNANSSSCSRSTSITLTRDSLVEVSPLCPDYLDSSTCVGGSWPGVQVAYFSGTITLPTRCNDWIFSYSLCCRNNAIDNLVAPGGRNLYI